MSEFDTKARDWDSNPDHVERADAIARKFLQMVLVNKNMTALEYGAGTGLMSFILAKHFSRITLMDSSQEMINVIKEKISSTGYSHFKPLFFDLETNEYSEDTFDCIYLQMVLHHVNDTGRMIRSFYKLLNPGGYLVIADLYMEDGSFHGEGFSGHPGFDVIRLQNLLENTGFHHSDTQPCYIRKKFVGDSIREFPVFLMVAGKPT